MINYIQGYIPFFPRQQLSSFLYLKSYFVKREIEKTNLYLIIETVNFFK